MQLPVNPTINEIYTIPSGNAKFIWNGKAWDRFSYSPGPDGNTSRKLQISFSVEKHKEIPDGLSDGYNFIFDLQYTPIEGTEYVFVNGLLQKSGDNDDYIMYKNSIYFIEPPYEGSIVACSYNTMQAIENKNEIGTRLDSKTVVATNTILPGKEMIFLNGLLQLEGLNRDYTLDSNMILFNSDLHDDDIIIINYHS
jgi:hypothetical protein